jgi:4-hydroxy-3-methylbut-2-enyl diphosphate reductase
MGQARDGMYLVEDEADVAALAVRDPDRLAFVTQTTLSLDDTARVIAALRARFPNIRGPKRDDICYATQNRQDAVRALAGQCQVVLVVGSRNSSNSNRLREVAELQGARAYMIDGPEDIRREWLESADMVGITAGASAPELLVQRVIDRIRSWGADSVSEQDGEPETITFALPRGLRGG